MKKFTISILTYTALDRVKECLRSVLENSNLDECRLILTANGNPDAEWQFRKLANENKHLDIAVVVNDRNEGFIPPNRKALEMCDSPYFVMLNDDAIVPPRWLEMLGAAITSGKNIALAGPSGSCCSLKPNLDGYPGALFEYVEGSCLMGKTEILKRHGLFGKYLKFAYGEDADLSLRLRRAGFGIAKAPFKIEHHRQSTSKHIPGINKQRLENQGEVLKHFRHYLKVRKFGYPITVVRRGAIGDVLLTTGIVERLKFENPLSQIYVETDCVEVYRDNPFVTKAANRIRLGDKSEQRINLDMAYENRPYMNYVSAYAEVAGVFDFVPIAKIYPNACEKVWAEKCIGKEPWTTRRWCVIHAGPSWVGRAWNDFRWEVVIKHLHDRGYKVVLVGGKNSISVGDLDARGRTSLHQLAALIANCKLFIGIDSLPMHLASIQGIETIGLFGITLPDRVFSTKTNTHAVCSDPSHPESGVRHASAGKTMIHVRSDPMDTISAGEVMDKIDEVNGVKKS